MVLFAQCTVCAFTALIQLAPRDSLALIIYVVTRLICVTPHPSRHHGSFCQDHVGFHIAGVLKAIRTRSRTTNQKQDVRLHLPGGMVIFYIYTSHLSVASRAGFLLNKRSQILYTAVSPTWPHDSLFNRQELLCIPHLYIAFHHHTLSAMTAIGGT